ncbi:MAG: ATP-binding protein [Acidobacteriota bacterium]
MKFPKRFSFAALKLHTKTTLLISIVLIVVFTVAGYFSNLTINNLTAEDEKYQSELLAVRVAEIIEQNVIINKKSQDKPPENRFADAQAEAFVPVWTESKKILEQSFLNAHKEIVEARVYYKNATGEWVETLLIPATVQSPNGSSKAFKPIGTGNREIIATRHQGDQTLITVEASIDISDDRGVNQFGVVQLLLSFDESQSFGTLLRKTLLPSFILTIITITLLVYFLFKYLIYIPLDNLLAAMSKAQSGDLAIEVPIASQDELGMLTNQFNRMAEQLHQEHALLEARIREATIEISERSEQLEDANLHLFEMQKELSKLEKLATAGQLAAQFAHEVGTPLNLISGHVQLLRARTTDERITNRLAVIEAQIDRVTEIVRAMLDAIKRPRPKYATGDINKILENILYAMQPTLSSRQVKLSKALADNLPTIYANADQLQQVFLNLINNSLDAMPEGGNLLVATSLEEENILIKISDTGKGIPVEEIGLIFEPLFSTKREQGGTGLGLTIVKQIILEHGGEIRAESETGKLTNFLIKLPKAENFVNESGGIRNATIIW